MKHFVLILALTAGITGSALAQGWLGEDAEFPEVTVTVETGDMALPHVPMVVSLDEEIPFSEPVVLTSDELTIPALPLPDTDGDGGVELAFMLHDVEPGQTLTFTLERGRAPYANPLEVNWSEDSIRFTINGFPFTEYHLNSSPQVPRPIFYPLYGPDGVSMTRSYPMEEKEGEATDHPHHQSLWVSHGDVNGVNFWHLDDDQGYQQNMGVNYVHASAVVSRFSQTVWWVDAEGTPLIEETRIITVWGAPEEARFIDYDMTFSAVDGPVVFGDTKEGGLISLRVASSMRSSPLGDNTPGEITNSLGDVGESEAWGKTAPWCDYSGEVDGMDVGLSILCHPDNPLPSYYHVRGYGLFTANPFGLSYFYRDDDRDGSQTLEPGEPWRFRYRVYIHSDDAEGGQVAEAFAAYATGVTAVAD